MLRSRLSATRIAAETGRSHRAAAGPGRSKPRGERQQKVAGRLVISGAFDTVIRDILAEPEQRLCQNLGVDEVVCEHGFGMDARRYPAAS